MKEDLPILAPKMDLEEKESKPSTRPLSLNLPKKKSIFSRAHFQEDKIVKVTEAIEEKEGQEEEQPSSTVLELPITENNEIENQEIEPKIIYNKELLNDTQLILPSRLKSHEPKTIPPTIQISRQYSLGNSRPNGTEPNKALNQTRKLLSMWAESDAKPTVERKIAMPPKPILALTDMDDKENKVERSTSTVALMAGNLSSSSFKNDCSPQNADEKSSTMSPSLSSKPMTPASSSLLLRRLSRKSSNGINISGPSTISSPLSDFTKVNSLEVLKSPRSMAQKEARFNHSYRIFLANRPQNWEENAVTLILSSIKLETNIRVLLPNLSLASSFLKIRQKKKSNEAWLQRIYSDTSPAYLFFNEKMVEKGDTKYKVSPPFRNRENRRLLVENLRLGGIDVMSSYHFFVPPRFKQVDDGNFRRAFGGLDSMGCSLQAAWTAAYSFQQKTNKKFTDDLIYQRKTINHILRQIYKSMCYNPAQMLKIGERKGTIAKGRDADFVLWDPYKMDNNNNLGINHAFSGRALLGSVCRTYLRGNIIYNKDHCEDVSRDYQPEFIRP